MLQRGHKSNLVIFSYRLIIFSALTYCLDLIAMRQNHLIQRQQEASPIAARWTIKRLIMTNRNYLLN